MMLKQLKIKIIINQAQEKGLKNMIIKINTTLLRIENTLRAMWEPIPQLTIKVIIM